MKAPHTSPRLTALTFIAALTLGVATFAWAADSSTANFMKKYHKAPKGTDPVCKKAGKGEASKEELQALLTGYQAMAKEQPPKGDAASWKEKTMALVTSTQGLIKGDAAAPKAYGAAVNCKACHDVHKGD
jgi:hypothetical protein